MKALYYRRLLLAGLLSSILSPPLGAETIQDMSLRAAIHDGRTQEAIRLLEQGADVNGRTSGGYTPLMIAAGVGNEEMVRLLLARGADPGLLNDSGWSAAYLARINNHSRVVTLLEQATRTAATPSAGPGTKPATSTQETPTGPTTPPPAAPAPGARGWPALGAYAVGQQVLYSGSAGKTWQTGVIRSIDPVYGYNIEGVSGSLEPGFVVGTQREGFWTAWFVGDWKVSVPMAMGVTLQGNDLYRTVSGGMRLPPLRIEADGSYLWRVQQTQGGETLLRGRWRANPDGPGVILEQAVQGEDWLVYNTSRPGQPSDTVILASAKQHLDGTRLK
jgi:hypothetical protein